MGRWRERRRESITKTRMTGLSEPTVNEDQPAKLEYDVAKYLTAKFAEKRIT